VGWTCKQAAVVLDVHPAKVTQAMGPAIHKVALLLMASVELTFDDLNEEMARIRRDRAERRTDNESRRILCEPSRFD